MPTQARTAAPTDGARQCIAYEANCVGDGQRASSFAAVPMPTAVTANDAALNSTADTDSNRSVGRNSMLP